MVLFVRKGEGRGKEMTKTISILMAVVVVVVFTVSTNKLDKCDLGLINQQITLCLQLTSLGWGQ